MTLVQYARHTGASQARQLEHYLLLGATAVLGLLSAMSLIDGLTGSFTAITSLLAPSAFG